MSKGIALSKIGRSTSRWKRRRWIGPRLHAVFTLPLVAGCTELPHGAKQELNKAGEDYRRQDYGGAQTKLDGIISTYHAYSGVAEAHYLRALVYVKQSNKAGALADAERCLALSQDKALTSQAAAMAGTLAFEAGDEARALYHFARALKGLPEKPPTDLVRYRYAVCLQHEGRWTEARREFGTVVQRYPQSTITENARRMYEWKGDYFAIQCGAYQDQSSATKQMKKLRTAGLSPRIESQSRLGKTLYMVFVGQYPKYAAAQEALRSIRAKVPNAVIAP
ncbi:MAG TPA: SPOR domain-containing protein [Phycisphaerae bacterium]|nr:SPOR domain-containing protein [Phycisphaerae bacterium]